MGSQTDVLNIADWVGKAPGKRLIGSEADLAMHHKHRVHPLPNICA